MALETTPSEKARSEARRRAILDVARDTFLERGYAAASMSEIATRLGGSKGTLYNYYRSKEELFAAFMTETCQARAAAIFAPLPPIGKLKSVRESLVDLGVTLMEFLLSEEMISLHRLILAETGRFPELGRMFYEGGPQRGEVRFKEYFEAAMDAGLVRRDDAQMVGQRLKDLVMSDIYLRRLWGVLGDFSPRQLRAHVAASVDIFLRAFGPEIA
ncbi:MAG TPA: TetR/AcrR family transcriptional regulator [Caulobacteraceae bacterium]|jgi:AcrR family transcriptional regulator